MAIVPGFMLCFVLLLGGCSNVQGKTQKNTGKFRIFPVRLNIIFSFRQFPYAFMQHPQSLFRPLHIRRISKILFQYQKVSLRCLHPQFP